VTQVKVRVKEYVSLGEDLAGKPRVFAPGQIVELDEATATASPWAFEVLPAPSPESQITSPEEAKP